MSPRWTAPLLDLLDAGMSIPEAREQVGVTSNAFYHQIKGDAAFAAAVDRARQARLQRQQDLVLLSLRSGGTLAGAALMAGVSTKTVGGWRRRSAAFDAAVLAAAAEGGHRVGQGGRTALRPVVRLECPGPHCGTPTGYDYGCGEDPCRHAKTSQVMQPRRQGEAP